LQEEYNGLEKRRDGVKKVEFIKGRGQFARRIEWIRGKKRYCSWKKIEFKKGEQG
jgi:hypothetical protein